MRSDARIVRAPRGTQISCKGWPQEAALRMLTNNLDPAAAELPPGVSTLKTAGYNGQKHERA